MIIVCAWCNKYLRSSEQYKDSISHTICPTCMTIQKWEHRPTLVVSRKRTNMLPVLKDLFASASKVQLVVDKRNDERRDFVNKKIDAANEKRGLSDRREGADFLLR